ncbi:hypothetical protein JCM10212_005041 [Sporobolomyces blumeae]
MDRLPASSSHTAEGSAEPIEVDELANPAEEAAQAAAAAAGQGLGGSAGGGAGGGGAPSGSAKVKKGKRGANGDGDDGDEGGDKKRRNRKPVTCAQCRRRKLKCDRGYPCGACRDRQEGHLCEWEGAIRLPQPHLTRDAEAQELRMQLDRFETLLGALTANPAAVAAAVAAGGNGAASGSGPAGPSTGVAEKGAAEALSLLATNPASSTTPKVANSIARAQLLAQAQCVEHLVGLLPAKKELDVLVNRFLGAEMNFLPIVHVPTFQKRMASFSHASATEDPFLLALLFAIISFEMGWQITEPSLAKTAGVEKESAMKRFFEASNEALRMAGFMEAPNLDVVRTLIVLYQCALQQLDPRSSYLLSQAIHVAQALGLNRDPEVNGVKDVIETQERRRIWWILVGADWLDQSGRVSCISINEYDTLEPASAWDVDITESGVKTRPFPAFTPCLYLVLLHQLGNYNQLISQSFFSVKPREPITWGKIGESNIGLDRLKANLPQIEWDAAGKAVRLPDDNYMSDRFRIFAHMTLLRLVIRVNRPFLARAMVDPRFADARERTLQAAQQLLGIFLGYSENTQIARLWQISFHALNALCIIAVDLYQDPNGSRAGKHREAIASASNSFRKTEHKSKISQEVLRVVEVLAKNAPNAPTQPRATETSLEPSAGFSVKSLPVPLPVDPFAFIETSAPGPDRDEEENDPPTAPNPELVSVWHEITASYPAMYAVPDKREWEELVKSSEARWMDGIGLVAEPTA